MPEQEQCRRKKPISEGIDMEISWEAMFESVFAVELLNKKDKTVIESGMYKEIARNDCIEYNGMECGCVECVADNLEECPDIDLADIADVLTTLHGKQHAIYLMARLQSTLSKIWIMCEQDRSQEREVTEEDKEIIQAIIISSYSRRMKNESVYSRIGVVLHLISIGLNLWRGCI